MPSRNKHMEQKPAVDPPINKEISSMKMNTIHPEVIFPFNVIMYNIKNVAAVK